MEHAHQSAFSAIPRRTGTTRSNTTTTSTRHHSNSTLSTSSLLSIATDDDDNDGDGSGSQPADLACVDTNDVTYTIKNNLLVRTSASPDLFNSNGKYYLLNAVAGEELSYVKFRVLADLIHEIRPCFGFVRDGRTLSIQMSTTNYLECPAQRDEYAGVCNRYFYANGQCQSGRCTTQQFTAAASGSTVGDPNGTKSSSSSSDAVVMVDYLHLVMATITLGVFLMSIF
ncbi:hypothetical protein SmJEL517_g04710 [Synchytrium microbalum]|uniref:Uncharacterized protein n=1 Tax=Synchytrium microbalum TaxID=1806994 RepID=A0A507BQY3_9FUNG|nr:uncharacterized protein SmJEL517_g04710 [Synchytrium microbalum]TPX32160.1 hypothetical protein SmJEL517_g04710 [Synchytrium microbalum]